MSKPSKPSDETPKDDVSDAVETDLETSEAEIAEAERADGEGTLGVAKKTKAERDAEKAEARREAEREALRRRTTPQPVKLDGGKNPGWWVPTMLGFMVLGLIWLVVYYLSGSSQYPVPSLKQWNMGVGFALIMIGFVMTTRWK